MRGIEGSRKLHGNWRLGGRGSVPRNPRLVSAICMEISDEWEVGMICLNVNEL